MKKILLLPAFILCFACEKETVKTPENTLLLQEITVGGKIHQRFEYEDTQLAKEVVFTAGCEENPMLEYTYVYQNSKLSKLSIVTRAIYSNINTICDPASGISYEMHFEYNGESKISKTVQDSSYSEFFYNSGGLVEKYVVYDLGGQAYAGNNYKYDSRGNLIQVTHSDGNTTHYQYDNKINPFYHINQRPGWISPFNKSPNNVIKATGNENFERTFEYNEEGLPVQVLETNGLTYSYSYQ